jgi:hypothetical protein
MRRWAGFAVLVLVAAGIALAVVPFARPGTFGSFTTAQGTPLSKDCASPIVSAWRDSSGGGWYGYAPLTTTPSFTSPSCLPKARTRLELAGAMAIGAAVLTVVLRRPRPAQPTIAPA